jgi:hypothetical protein
VTGIASAYLLYDALQLSEGIEGFQVEIDAALTGFCLAARNRHVAGKSAITISSAAWSTDRKA